MLIEFIIGLLVVGSILLSVLLKSALTRITQYEEILIQFDKIISLSSEKIKEVDLLGHYESDDETGFFFETIKELQSALDDLFESGDDING